MLAALIAVFANLLGAGTAPVVSVDAATGTAMREQILRSTVQIEMVGEAWVEDDRQHRLGAQGLGTVVQAGNGRFILTHDHWSLANEDLSQVTLRNAHGAQLLVVDGATFLSLVRYRDGGAMLLETPQELSGLAPAALHEGPRPLTGDIVWLPARAGAGNGLMLNAARVEMVHENTVPGTLQLHAAPEAVAAGDSGAGVWFDGKLVANLWAVTEVRTVVIGESWPWSRWFGGAGDWRRTGVMLAGLQPLQGATGLTAQDLASETPGEHGHERGPQK